MDFTVTGLGIVYILTANKQAICRSWCSPERPIYPYFLLYIFYSWIDLKRKKRWPTPLFRRCSKMVTVAS